MYVKKQIPAERSRGCLNFVFWPDTYVLQCVTTTHYECNVGRLFHACWSSAMAFHGQLIITPAGGPYRCFFFILAASFRSLAGRRDRAQQSSCRRRKECGTWMSKRPNLCWRVHPPWWCTLLRVTSRYTPYYRCLHFGHDIEFLGSDGFYRFPSKKREKTTTKSAANGVIVILLIRTAMVLQHVFTYFDFVGMCQQDHRGRSEHRYPVLLLLFLLLWTMYFCLEFISSVRFFFRILRLYVGWCA